MKVEDSTLVVMRALERMAVRHYLTGSLASSLHGEPRATNDADLVAQLSLGDLARLQTELGNRFHVDEEDFSHAVTSQRSFNLVDEVELAKVDVFCVRDEGYQRDALARIVRLELVRRVSPGEQLGSLQRVTLRIRAQIAEPRCSGSTPTRHKVLPQRVVQRREGRRASTTGASDAWVLHTGRELLEKGVEVRMHVGLVDHEEPGQGIDLGDVLRVFADDCRTQREPFGEFPEGVFESGPLSWAALEQQAGQVKRATQHRQANGVA